MIRARQYSVTGACMRGETQNVSYGVACRLRNGEIAQPDYPALGWRRISTVS